MSRELLQQALDALEALQGGCTDSNDGTVEAITVWCPELIDAIRTHLAAPQPEPAAEAHEMQDGTVAILAYPGADFQMGQRFYTTPPIDGFGGNLDEAFDAAPAVPLTDEQIDALWRAPMSADWEHREFARAIEQAHGIGGGNG